MTTDTPIVVLDGLGYLQGDLCPDTKDIVRFLDVRVLPHHFSIWQGRAVRLEPCRSSNHFYRPYPLE